MIAIKCGWKIPAAKLAMEVSLGKSSNEMSMANCPLQLLTNLVNAMPS